MADRSVVYRLRADVTQFRAQMAAAGSSVKDAADKMTAANKSGSNFRNGLTGIGNTAGKVALVTGAGLGAMVVAAANFDQAMSKVQAATHDSADEMDRLRTAAIKAGQDTKFSASEAAGGIEALAKAGVSTTDILKGGLDGALSLAAAGNQSVGDAAETAASAMTQFKLAGKDIPHIADLLAAGAGKAQGEVSDLAQALNQVGLVAAQTGLSVDETTAGLAAFASAGLIGSDAGTSFKTMLLRLTPTSGKAKEEMDKLGISAFDAQGNFVGLANFAGILHDALKNMSAEQRQTALSIIFGQDAIRGANVLYEQGTKGINKWTTAVDDQGFAAETAAIKMDNLRGDLEQLRGSLETALIGAGEGSQGPLRELVQHLTSVVNAYNNLPSAGQNAITGILGVTTALGAGLFVASKVVNTVSDLRDALDRVGISAGRSSGKLVRIGATAGTMIVAAQAMGALANATLDLGRAVNASDISRDLERIAGGGKTASLNDLAGALKGVNEAGAGTVNALFAVPSALTGIKTSFKTDTDTIEGFDQALASLVESGHAKEAAEAFQAIKDAASDRGISGSDVTSRFDAYNTALQNAASSSDDVGTAASSAAGGVTQLTKSTQKANDALKAEHKAARDSAESFIDISKNVDKAKVSLGEWIRQMAQQADALQHFRENATAAAKKGLDEGLIRSLQKLGPEGALRMRQLANATDDQINKANKAWERGQRQVQLFDDTLGGVPDTKHVHLYVDGIDPALAKAEALASKLRGIHDRTIHVTTEFFTGGRSMAGNAEGGTIPGQRQPYGDKVLRWLAPGEEVISNRDGQADRWRPLLKAINAGRMASGGTVGASSPMVGPGIDYGRLTRALLSARPLYGPVSVNGDPTAFRTTMEQDARRAGLGASPHG